VVLAWATFERSSTPGIRRPRWGGVVEGVAVSATPSRTNEGLWLEVLTPPPK